MYIDFAGREVEDPEMDSMQERQTPIEKAIDRHGQKLWKKYFHHVHQINKAGGIWVIQDGKEPRQIKIIGYWQAGETFHAQDTCRHCYSQPALAEVPDIWDWHLCW